jgi:hypothetical protein
MANQDKLIAPVLVPIAADQFWSQLRAIVREEVLSLAEDKTLTNAISVNGLSQKPLFDMDEVRALFSNVSRSTIYEWIGAGLLKPLKLKGKVYFLWSDIEKLWQNKA